MVNKHRQALNKITLQHYQKHFEQFHGFLRKRYSDPVTSVAFVRMHPKQAARDMHLLVKGGTLYAGLLHVSGLAQHYVNQSAQKEKEPQRRPLTSDPQARKEIEKRYGVKL